MRTSVPFLALLASALFAFPVRGGEEVRSFSHDLKPGGIAEECLRLELGANRRFEWSADRPVDFNIHFHRGDQVSFPVKLDGQRKGSGTFRAPASDDYCWMWTAKFATRITGTLGPDR